MKIYYYLIIKLVIKKYNKTPKISNTNITIITFFKLLDFDNSLVKVLKSSKSFLVKILESV